MGTRRHREDPDFFFPVALITAGVIWLMVNNGMIAQENLVRLVPLWPVLLIGGGLSLLLRRLWWPLTALLWLGIAAILIWVLVASPALLPSFQTQELRQVTLREPVGGATSAAVTLDLSINPTDVRTSAGDDLVLADLYVSGEPRLDVSGDARKTVRLRGNTGVTFNFLDFRWLNTSSQPWDIRLTDRIPLELKVDASTGRANIDLTGAQLESLEIEASTGSMDIILPAEQETFPFRLDGSTGSIGVRVPAGTGVEMRVDASTGSLTIDVPDDAGLQVEVVDDGTGGLRLPAGMEKVRGSDRNEEGVYENDAFAGADNPITIRLDISTGSVTIR
jgi:hypothetical protein